MTGDLRILGMNVNSLGESANRNQQNANQGKDLGGPASYIGRFG
jgi:hypothetical protein